MENQRRLSVQTWKNYFMNAIRQERLERAIQSRWKRHKTGSSNSIFKGKEEIAQLNFNKF